MVAGKARRPLADRADAHAVMVEPGQQRRPRRRTRRGGVEVAITKPAGAERVDVRRADPIAEAAVATELRIPEVVEHDPLARVRRPATTVRSRRVCRRSRHRTPCRPVGVEFTHRILGSLGERSVRSDTVGCHDRPARLMTGGRRDLRLWSERRDLRHRRSRPFLMKGETDGVRRDRGRRWTVR